MQNESCYLPHSKPVLELELENFARQIVTTLNKVIKKADQNSMELELE